MSLMTAVMTMTTIADGAHAPSAFMANGHSSRYTWKGEAGRPLDDDPWGEYWDGVFERAARERGDPSSFTKRPSPKVDSRDEAHVWYDAWRADRGPEKGSDKGAVKGSVKGAVKGSGKGPGKGLDNAATVTPFTPALPNAPASQVKKPVVPVPLSSLRTPVPPGFKGRPRRPAPATNFEEPGKGQQNDDLTATYKFTNTEIIGIARDHPTKLKETVEYLIATDRPMNMINIATILYSAGKLRMSLPETVVSALCDKIKHLQHDEEFNAKSISNSLYGLQRFRGTEQVRKLLGILAPMVAKCDELFRAQHVGNSLYGLQRLGDSQEVRLLVAALAPKVANCDEDLNSQAVSNALYGLQSLQDSPEAKRMIAALATQVKRCTEELSAQHIGNALFGLQSFTDGPEIRQLLHSLIPLVEKSTAMLNGQAIVNAFFGIERLGETEETRWLMAVLTPKLVECKKSLSPRDWNLVTLALQRLPRSFGLDKVGLP